MVSVAGNKIMLKKANIAQILYAESCCTLLRGLPINAALLSSLKPLQLAMPSIM